MFRDYIWFIAMRTKIYLRSNFWYAIKEKYVFFCFSCVVQFFRIQLKRKQKKTSVEWHFMIKFKKKMHFQILKILSMNAYIKLFIRKLSW